MYYIVETQKSFELAAADLAAAVTRPGLGVLHIHDLGATLRSKGTAFDEECRIFEICNPAQTAKALSIDMRPNMALPCRISVLTEKGRTKPELTKPVQMLTALSPDATLPEVAKEVEKTPIRMTGGAM